MLKTNITEAIHQYALTIGMREPQIATDLREYTVKNFKNHQMLTPPEQAQFMAFLVKLITATKYLEIGVFTGYSTLIMALALKNNQRTQAATDLEIIAIDNNYHNLNTARNFWQMAQVDDIITSICNDATDALKELENKRKHPTQLFDIAYIDANKAAYLSYYESAYKLIRCGGIIIIDNIFLNGRVAKLTPDAPNYVVKMAEFNQFIYNDTRVDISVLNIGDGLTLAYKL